MWMGKADAQGKGNRRTRRKPLSNDRGLGLRSRPEGGVEEVRATEEGIGRKIPSDRSTPGSDRDLGAVQGRQQFANRTRTVVTD